MFQGYIPFDGLIAQEHLRRKYQFQELALQHRCPTGRKRVYLSIKAKVK